MLMQRVRIFKALSTKWDAFITPSPPGSDLSRRGNREVAKPEVKDNSKEIACSKKSKTEAHMNSETASTSTRSAQVQARQRSRMEKGKWAVGTMSHSYPRSCWQLIADQEGNPIFSNGVVWVYQPHSRASLWSGSLANTKWIPRFLCFAFLLSVVVVDVDWFPPCLVSLVCCLCVSVYV